MKRLYDLDPAEVSLVGKAANKKKFLVFKSRKGNEMSKSVDTIMKAVDEKTMARIEKSLKLVPVKKDGGDMAPRKDSAVFKEGDEQQPQEHGLSDQAHAAMKAVSRILAPHKEELNKGHLEAVAHELGMGDSVTEKTDGMESPGDKAGSQMAIPEDVKEEHHMGALGEAQKAYSAHLEKMGYRKYADQQPTEKSKKLESDDSDTSEEDDVSKTAVSKSDKGLDLSSFPENQRAQLELIFKSNQELVQKNLDLEKQLNDEKDLRVTKEFQERVKSFKHLGANSDELATVLKSLNATNPEAAKKIESVLKAADTQLGTKDLYTELGSRVSKSSAGSPEAKLDALVDSFVQKSDGEKSREQIYEDVLMSAEGQRLYAEMKSSRPNGI